MQQQTETEESQRGTQICNRNEKTHAKETWKEILTYKVTKISTRDIAVRAKKARK